MLFDNLDLSWIGPRDLSRVLEDQSRKGVTVIHSYEQGLPPVSNGQPLARKEVTARTIKDPRREP
jgi:hypothetical protein